MLRQALAGIPARVFTVLPVLAVLWTAAAAFGFGTYAAGGADSFGYISQAELLAHGRLTERCHRIPHSTGPTSRRR